MLVRTRTDRDLDACERLARLVHVADGYPPRPAVPDLRAFIASPSALAAWVADDGGRVVGHVALNPASLREVVALASRETGIPAAGLAFVARLLVAPDTRRRGIASTLLDVAADAARQRGLRPALDVAAHFEEAQSLYEKHGWVRAGRVTAAIDDCEPLDEFIYLAPAG